MSLTEILNKISLQNGVKKRSKLNIHKKFSSYYHRKLEEIVKNERTLAEYSPPRARHTPTFARLFYPKSKNQSIAKADYVVFPVIFISCIFAVGELFSEDAGSEFYNDATKIFLLFFLIEFGIRYYLKGNLYLFSWGKIDLPPIIIDLIAVLIASQLFRELVGAEFIESAAYGQILRTLRFLRLIRLLRILRVFRDPRFWLGVTRVVSPYIWALTLSTITVSSLLFGLMGVSVIFFGTDFTSAFDYFWNLLASAIDWPNAKGGEDLTVQMRQLYQIVSLLSAFAIINLIALVFVPWANKISDTHKSGGPLTGLTGHIVICLNESEYASVLEELAYVFTKYGRRETFVLLRYEDKSSQDSIKTSSVECLVGDTGESWMWEQVSARSAEAIIMLGEGDLRADDLPYVIVDPSRDELTLPQIIVLKNNQDYRRDHISLPLSCDIVRIPFQGLINAIEGNAWNAQSVQYSYIRKLTTEFDEYIEFPQMPDAEITEDEVSKISDFLQRDQTLTINTHQNNILVSVSENNPECSDISMIRAINRVLEQDDFDLTKVNIFCYTKDLYLFKLNLLYNKIEFANICIFAFELAVAFAIFHELRVPGVMQGWLSDYEIKDTSNYKLLELDPAHFGKYLSRSEIGTDNGQERSGFDVLAIVRSNPKSQGKHRFGVFTSHDSEKIYIDENDCILVHYQAATPD